MASSSATFDSLQERLSALQETTNSLKELIKRLATIEFQPGSVPLTNSSEDNVASELSAEIISILREEEDDLELRQEEIIDLRTTKQTESRKIRLKEAASRIEEELKACHKSFRAAQLSAQSSLRQAQKVERSLLLASFVPPPPPAQPNHPSSSSEPAPDARTLLFSNHRRQKPKDSNSPESDVINASSDVTLALRRTHALISSELSKSSFAAQTLAESSAALEKLQRNYDGLDDLLSQSRNLVSTLLTTQKSDTWYLQSALKILLITLGWLVFRRWVYGPAWWLVWLPLKMVFKTGKAVSSIGTSKGGATMEVVVPGEGGGERRTTVIGVGEEGAVPTIEIGRPEERPVEHGEGSMVDEIGRMVEDTLNAKEGSGVMEAENASEGELEVEIERNPKKRMWEENVVEKEEVVEVVRDEL
ncbi:hypothetical protein QBC42DRAFT_269070 [Cladorrhinum samala]|uniref:Sec20 C-terminal domain-containing protein n=1 Tax=Cladorrhinum samala TaxID=585594 RepID=A0AAV9HP92_9PEZI|nr:hypothetical protein QBC42DRAFT_269070 [Cladorrhinum samala]